MKYKKIYFLLFLLNLLYSCADTNFTKKKLIEKKYFTSSGFVLIYNIDYYKNKIINRKINNEEIILMHNSLKINTPIKIINPENQKFVETKVYKRSNYPGIFNAVISEKIVTILELDIDNPYVEIIQIKKNKKFIAKKANTFDEEKNVADTAPVESIEMDDLTNNTESNNVLKKENSYLLVINDFYYIDSAKNLKSELLRKINIKNLYIKKINNKKYRLYVGPFKNFNALKTTYISLNNLGFSDLNIYKE